MATGDTCPQCKGNRAYCSCCVSSSPHLVMPPAFGWPSAPHVIAIQSRLDRGMPPVDDGLDDVELVADRGRE